MIQIQRYLDPRMQRAATWAGLWALYDGDQRQEKVGLEMSKSLGTKEKVKLESASASNAFYCDLRTTQYSHAINKGNLVPLISDNTRFNTSWLVGIQSNYTAWIYSLAKHGSSVDITVALIVLSHVPELKDSQTILLRAVYRLLQAFHDLGISTNVSASLAVNRCHTCSKQICVDRYIRVGGDGRIRGIYEPQMK